MNIYKNKYLKYKNKYLYLKNEINGGMNYETAKQYSSLVKDGSYIKKLIPDIYYMSSHSCDNDKVLQVPNNCVYVTMAECGLSINDTDRSVRIFEKMFSENNIYLSDPITYYQQLQEIFGHALHIHYSTAPVKGSRSYMDTKYTCSLGWTDGNIEEGIIARNYSIHTSGLHTLGNFHRNIFTGDISNDIPKYTIETIYKDSLYPSYDNIIDKNKDLLDRSYENFQDLVEVFFTVTQSDLFEYFPGVHYNFACRSACKIDIDDVLLLRRESSFKFNSKLDKKFNKNSLIYNLKKGKYDKVIKLLSDNAYIDINEVDSKGNTPLHILCTNYNKGNIKLKSIFNSLIDNGADTLIKNNEGKTPHNMCFFINDSEIFHKLVSSTIVKDKLIK